MSSDLEALRRIVEAFERSDWEEIDVRWGNLRVHLSAAPSPRESIADPAIAPTERQVDVDVQVDPPQAQPSAPPSVSSDAHVVTSPAPGIFWRAPEPGAPPFTDIGQTVEPAATVCIVEVMKLMNHVKAGVGGKVIAVYAENGAAVAKGDPLFALVTAGGPAP